MSSYDEGEASEAGPVDEEGEKEKEQNSPETQSSGIPLEESCVSFLFVKVVLGRVIFFFNLKISKCT